MIFSRVNFRRVPGGTPTQAPTASRSHSAVVLTTAPWTGGRAVDCTGLENRRARKGTVGSNPTPSASRDHGPSLLAAAVGVQAACRSYASRRLT